MTGFILRISQGTGAYPHGAVTRREIECRIEERIACLDHLDGDPDDEPDPDAEPSLGWTRSMAWGNGLDLELEAAA